MGIRVLLLASPGEARTAYESALTSCGADYDSYATITELYRSLPDRTYNGLLIDVPTLVHASTTEKTLIHDLVEIFPSVRLRWDQKTAQIRTLYYGQFSGETSGLHTFITNQCQNFQERALRTSERITRHLNVLVSATRDFPQAETLQCVTFNVSKGGCFLIAPSGWPLRTKIWLKIIELDDDTPLCAEVCWHIKWGTSMRIPGMGVKFIEMTKSQFDRYLNLILN